MLHSQTPSDPEAARTLLKFPTPTALGMTNSQQILGLDEAFLLGLDEAFFPIWK